MQTREIVIGLVTFYGILVVAVVILSLFLGHTIQTAGKRKRR